MTEFRETGYLWSGVFELRGSESAGFQCWSGGECDCVETRRRDLTLAGDLEFDEVR